MERWTRLVASVSEAWDETLDDARSVGLQEFGIGLAVAIVVPALMALFGRWNWWLPPTLARAVRVRPSPLEAPTS